MSNPNDPNQPGQGQWGQPQQGQNQWGQPQQGQNQWGQPPVSIGGPPQQWQQPQPGLLGSYERGVDRAMAKVERVATCADLARSGCILLVVNVVFLGVMGLSYWFLSKSWHLAQNGTQTTGVVVDFEENRDSDGVSWSPIVEFEAGGETYTFDSSFSSSPKAYDLGEEVPVLYDPEDPQTADIKSWMSSPYLHGGVLGVELLAMLVVNFFFMRSLWRGQPISDE